MIIYENLNNDKCLFYDKLYNNKQKFNIYVLEKYNIENLVLKKLKFCKLGSVEVRILKMQFSRSQNIENLVIEKLTY